ncbi:MAG: dipeptide ABC transporter ATP-binding protein [Oscillospiraceae bacterium]|jgi:oligopeptide/dipeptide ABC transporter ATP-binding protein|nr:dipeptide ABC transporter ATP-binding protein [Oscillospiraceae bacterium]
MSEAILSVRGLSKHFDVKRGTLEVSSKLKAVDNIDFSIMPGETMGLVGESGCGKSTLGRTIVRIYDPTSGEIVYKGEDITTKKNKNMLAVRRSMQMIFQDPYASLDPRMTVGDIIAEPMNIHNLYTPEERKKRVQHLLETVGLKPDHIRRYPHEFSGGQRQRISIARTLALDPEFIICDEPISALDVSIQAQIVNLLERIQDETGISYLFIAHDLGIVRHISHKIGVMYLGNMMEYGATEDVYDNPYHPYTKALLSAVPVPDPKTAREKRRIILEGEVTAPIDPPDACLFANRCSYRCTVCNEKRPPAVNIGGRLVSCHMYTMYFRAMRGGSDKPIFEDETILKI